MTKSTWLTTALALAFVSLVSVGAGTAAEGTTKTDDKAVFREGAQLWPQVCGTCHNARPGGERSAAEWDTIMMHMRSVANLPEEDAEAIKAFLKAH